MKIQKCREEKIEKSERNKAERGRRRERERRELLKYRKIIKKGYALSAGRSIPKEAYMEDKEKE